MHTQTHVNLPVCKLITKWRCLQRNCAHPAAPEILRVDIFQHSLERPH